jgi:glycosyltransferase involved in cell wall biosynthesis
MRRTHLTYVIGSLSLGGAEGQLIELLKRMDRKQFRVSLVLFELSTADAANGLVDEVFSLQIPSASSFKPVVRGIYGLAAMLRLARYLRRSKPNIVHAILPASCILAAPAAKLARVPVIIAGRRSMAGCYRTDWLLSLADRIGTRSCDYAIGNSEAIRRELTEIDGLPAEKVGVVYNGVDTQRFRPGNRELRGQCGWREENVVFGVVANFIPYKRHTDFIRAARLIARSNPHARFVMAGEDRGILDTLKAQIRESGLEPFFTIIPGTREPERLYPGLDVYICTSQTEGLSNVLLEAGACGLPIIATRVGGNPEIVTDAYNGFLVSPRAPEAIAVKALQLASNPKLRRIMGERSRQRAISQFSLIAMVHAHETLYESLLKSRHGRIATEDSNAIVSAHV